MKRWAWGLGVVLALAGVLALLWPDTSSWRPDSSASASTRAGERGRGSRTAPEGGGPPGAPDADSRGDGALRGVVLSLLGQPMPGVSIVALALPEEGSFLWAGTCRAQGVTAERLEEPCDAELPPIDETLEAVQSRVPVLLRATTDAEGAFELTGLAEGLYEVWAEAPHGVAVRRVATGTEGTRFLLEDGIRVKGSIRDETEGPIAGASVVLVPRDLFRHFETFSGEDGSYAFSRVPMGAYRVLGSREGLLPDMYVLASQEHSEVTLTLEAPHVITGRVVRQGRGVPGVPVHAKGVWSEPTVLTDGQGHFTFDGVRRGDYTVAAYVGSEGAEVATQVVDGEPARVLLELQPCATLEGGVVGGSGAPLAEAEVTFHLHESHEFERSVRTDARGQYRFDCLLPGSFEVTARAKGFRPRALQDGERLLVAGETRRMDFRLAEEVPFDGIVVDTEGQALAGARVVMYWGADEYPPSEESLIETVQAITGEDGRFSAHGLAPGTYGVQIMLSEEFEVVHERAQVPGTGVRFVLVREPPAPGVIVGTVVGERGQPLAGVTVEAQMQPVGQREFVARTNEVGQFRLEKLPLATWSVTATHDGTALTGQVQAMARAEVRGPEPVLVQLQLGDGLSVSGRVVDGRGAPVPSVYVTATRSFPSSQEQLLGGSAETDEQGRFALHHLAPGDHDLEVRAQEPNSLLAPARGSVRAGSTDVRLVMGAMPQVQGRVVHADGSPVPSFIVNDTAFTGTEGRFLLPLPPPGPFAFVFRAEGLASTLRRLDAPHPSDAVLPDVTLVRGQAVRGRVLDADTGKPIEEAWVAPLDFAFHGVLSVDADQDAVWTQADGRFLLPAVEPGRVLCVEFEGYQPARLPLPRDGEEAVIRLRPLTPTKASDTPP